MMGRHPRLPIDSLFDFEGSDCSNTNVQEYVTEHFEKMKAAYHDIVVSFVLFSTRDGPDLSEGSIKYTCRSESIHLMIL
jgi:hypothetical protein